MSRNFTPYPGRITTMGEGMRHLFVSGEMSDVQFAVGRDYGAVTIFLAHRLLLSVRSAVFHTMFYGSGPQNRAAHIDIPEILPEAFANMLCYIYTDAVDGLTQDNAFHTLACADKYDLPLLMDICTDFVLTELSIGNCLDILDNAVYYAVIAPSILEECLCLIDESAEMVWQSEQFCAIGQEALDLILQRDSLTANEETIFAAVNRWAFSMCKQRNMKASAANRREVLGATRFLIRFPLLTAAKLLDGPVKSGLLLRSEGWNILHYQHAKQKPQLPFPTDTRQNVRAEGTINYTIPDLRELEETLTFSDPITVRKLLWRIAVTKWTDADGIPALGFYLHCDGCPESGDWNCEAAGELYLFPWKTEIAPIEEPVFHLFCQDDNQCGISRFMALEDLLDPTNGYVNPDDFSLYLQIHLTADMPTGIE
ncbi:BTB/POZ domain-containing protein 6-like [Paramacrobiotus metropolitanus]|uniref:BTB/POZ domain-containing protein 6-like n=1 Tax=Paramacrobiotus metropolitanus TaxID=2943436 RepID=UPI002445D5E1|nr:BTB/POZ domain-containing protein 6-like [Paramacrobiotus metropolitanus]